MNLLAFSTLACPSWSIPTVIEKAVEFGYRGLEWRGGTQGHIPPTMTARERASLRKMSDEAGLTALCITTYTSFVSPFAEERKSNVDELRRYSDFAAEIGAPYVRAFLGELPADTKLTEEIYENISGCLQVASAYAETVGVKIAVEPHDDFTRSSVVSTLLDRNRSYSDLRVIWDLGNTFAVGEDVEEGFNLLKDRLAYIQVKDGKIGKSGWGLCPVGHGDVPLARAFEFLLDSGYDGAFSVEWEYAWHPELDPPEIALPAARWTIQKLLSLVRSESA
jgi:sugar phosphate isomerase/epimerase